MEKIAKEVGFPGLHQDKRNPGAIASNLGGACHRTTNKLHKGEWGAHSHA